MSSHSPVPDASASHYVQPAIYTTGQMRGKAGFNYLEIGRCACNKLLDQISATSSSSVDPHSYKTKILHYRFASVDGLRLFDVPEPAEFIAPGNAKYYHRESLGSVFAAESQITGLNVDGDSGDWSSHRLYSTPEWVPPALNPIIKSYVSKSAKTLVVTWSSNRDDCIPAAKRRDYPVHHSDIWFDILGRALGDDDRRSLKLVIRAQIDNPDTVKIIKEARAQMRLHGGWDGEAELVTLRNDADGEVERDAFFALAGSSNGIQLFRMLGDHHVAFGDRKVECVRVYGDQGGMGPVLVWQLMSGEADE
jgi:hypothetical protein